ASSSSPPSPPPYTLSLHAALPILARAPLVLDRAHRLPSLRDAIKAEHLNGLARRRALDACADEVVHRPHAAEMRARYERVADPRSEEHTSELQSPYDLVCRLLLEK